MPQHRAQPFRIGDAAWQVTKLVTDIGELVQEARRSWARREQTAPEILVMLDDIVELTESVLTGNLGAEARPGLARVALEGRDRGMLVLDLAGDGAERAVGDVPGNAAPELPCAEVPGSVVRATRHGRCPRLTPPPIEVVAKAVEGADDLAGEVVLGGGAVLEHDPEAVDPASGSRRPGQSVKHCHGSAHGCDRHPLLGTAGDADVLIGGAANAMPCNQSIGAGRDRVAAGAHCLHLAVAHAGQIGADDIAGGLQPPLLAGERLLVEPVCAPWSAVLGVDRDRRVHAADLAAQPAAGIQNTEVIAVDLADLGGAASNVQCDQRVVHTHRVEPAEDGRIVRPDRDTAATGTQASDIGVETLADDGSDGPAAVLDVDIDLAGTRVELVKLGPA